MRNSEAALQNPDKRASDFVEGFVDLCILKFLKKHVEQLFFDLMPSKICCVDDTAKFF